MKQSFLALSILFAIAGCSTAQPPATASIPDKLLPSSSERLVASFPARGWQIYECRSDKADAKLAKWAFVAPEAELVDDRGAHAAKHYAGPHWEAPDGSKIRGTVVASANATEPGAIPWLLLRATSVGPAGAFSGVTSVQRVNTHGGEMPAAAGCTPESVGKQMRVKYTADYVMFRAR